MSSIAKQPCCANCGQGINILKCQNCWKADGSNQSQIQGRLTETATAPQQHALIKQVDDWECNAIIQIRRTAEEARQRIIKNTTDRISQVQTQLAQLNEQLRQSLQKNNFEVQHVRQWQEQLSQLSTQLTTPAMISVRQVSFPLVTKILVDLAGESQLPNIPANAKWAQNGITVAGGNGQGNGLNQLYQPIGFCIDEDQTIYVAEYSNHRVVEWKSGATNGRVVAGGNGTGNQMNQLNNPGSVVIDKESGALIICEYSNKRVMRWARQNNPTGETLLSDVCSYELATHVDGYLYVSDYGKHEVKRWKIGEKDGIVVAGGHGSGARLDQLSNPMGIFIDEDRTLYVVDRGNHRIVKWIEGANEGIVVAGGQGAGNGLVQLCSPWGVVVDQLCTVYVADDSNNRVMRWTQGAKEGSIVVGGNGSGAQPNQFNRCMHLSFDQQGNLLVSDFDNHRIQKFNIDPNSIQ